MKGLTDIPGITVGHASDYDGLTGCTAVLCEQGAVAGGDAGCGATVGKILGSKQAMKSGVGSWTVPLEGRNANVTVSALAVVNALGDVRDPATAKIIAGARKAADSMEFADSARLMKSM